MNKHTLPVQSLVVGYLVLTLGACTPARHLSTENAAAADEWVQEANWADGITRNDNATSFASTRLAAANGGLSEQSSNSQIDEPPPTPPDASAARQVIYTGRLTVLSPDPAAAIDRARQLAEDLGGYADAVRRQSVRLRVPAAKFDAAMQALAELGLVTDRAIDAADVTAELVDLQLRLDNLEALRQRMKALLERAERVEDMLAIEKELGRLAGEIEQLKGQLRLTRDRVALSTITVTFNAPSGTASGLAGRVRPFAWVNSVGDEAFGARPLPHAQPKLGRAPKLTLPGGFVRFYQKDHRVFAIDRGQVVVKLTRQPNFDQADVGFWVDQVRDRLTTELGVPTQDPVRRVTQNRSPVLVIHGQRPAGQKPLGYLAGLAANDKHVFVLEAWGPADELERQAPALIESLETLQINRGWW
ncbi:MAG: DUF4349 domain-containing protein [Planctomycetota bacterium]